MEICLYMYVYVYIFTHLILAYVFAIDQHFTLHNLHSDVFCITGGGRGQSANSSIISDAHSCNSCVSKYFLYNCLLLFSRENIIHVCLCVIKLFIYIIIVHPRSMVKLLNPLSLNLWQLCGHCTSYVYLRFFQI